MLIAHLSAGYLLSKKLQGLLKIKRYMWIGLLGSILPDFDIFYFYFIDNKNHLHHSYWTHIPFYWLCFFILIFTTALLSGRKKYQTMTLFFFLNIFMHLIFDTVNGKIEWLYPFSAKSLFLFSVPEKYDFWVFNFLFHWTFLIEILLTVWALILLIKNSVYLKKLKTLSNK